MIREYFNLVDLYRLRVFVLKLSLLCSYSDESILKFRIIFMTYDKYLYRYTVVIFFFVSLLFVSNPIT